MSAVASLPSKSRSRHVDTQKDSPPLYEVTELPAPTISGLNGLSPPSTSSFALVTPATNVTKKSRAKRLRLFIVEFRLTPSKLGEFFGRTATAWEPEAFGDYRKLADARAHVNGERNIRGAGYFTRGTEYRVRRTDTKVA